MSRIDTEPRGCLATDQTSSKEASTAAWNGLLQAAKADRSLLVQRFAEPSAVRRSTFINTLVQMRCTVIVTVGDELSSTAASTQSSNVRFLGLTTTAPPRRALDTLPSRSPASSIKTAILNALADG